MTKPSAEILLQRYVEHLYAQAYARTTDEYRHFIERCERGMGPQFDDAARSVADQVECAIARIEAVSGVVIQPEFRYYFLCIEIASALRATLARRQILKIAATASAPKPDRER